MFRIRRQALRSRGSEEATSRILELQSTTCPSALRDAIPGYWRARSQASGDGAPNRQCNRGVSSAPQRAFRP
eukprot:10828390-Alexandrium_andersonii.AAC.1